MKNPLDSLSGTAIAGGVITAVLFAFARKILGMVFARDNEISKARRVAFLASRTNTMLSIPMLFFMATGMSHSALFSL